MDPASGFLFVTWTDPTTIGAAAVALGLLAFVVWRASQAPAPAAPEEESSEAPKRNLASGKAVTLAELREDEEVDSASFLSRFVLNARGETVGETMGLTDDSIVLKHEGRFMVVSLDAILQKDGVLLADANIDWEAARKAGDAWREASHDTIEYDDEGMPVLDKGK